MKKHAPKLATALVFSVFSVACAGAQPSPEEPAAATEAALPAGKTVESTIEPKSGSTLSGKATLTETPEGVRVELTVAGVSPGSHGAHIHENGDCSSPDGNSAGGHFNPASHPHGLPATSPRHLGDLGNIEILADGTGTLDFLAPGANLKEGDPSSFLGRALIIHEKTDDGGQPTGNAGGRIGCAVIQQ